MDGGVRRNAIQQHELISPEAQNHPQFGLNLLLTATNVGFQDGIESSGATDDAIDELGRQSAISRRDDLIGSRLFQTLSSELGVLATTAEDDKCQFPRITRNEKRPHRMKTS